MNNKIDQKKRRSERDNEIMMKREGERECEFDKERENAREEAALSTAAAPPESMRNVQRRRSLERRREKEKVRRGE